MCVHAIVRVSVYAGFCKHAVLRVLRLHTFYCKWSYVRNCLICNFFFLPARCSRFHSFLTENSAAILPSGTRPGAWVRVQTTGFSAYWRHTHDLRVRHLVARNGERDEPSPQVPFQVMLFIVSLPCFFSSELPLKLCSWTVSLVSLCFNYSNITHDLISEVKGLCSSAFLLACLPVCLLSVVCCRSLCLSMFNSVRMHAVLHLLSMSALQKNWLPFIECKTKYYCGVEHNYKIQLY